MSAESISWPTWLPHVLWIRRKCPSCTCTEFKPAETRAVDALLAMFLLRPIRCTWCWRRFYWLSFHIPA